MKSVGVVASLIVAAVSASSALAQMKDTKPNQPPAAAMSADKGAAMKGERKPAARKDARSMAAVDARHCLQLATNMAIHQCAEKYRPR